MHDLGGTRIRASNERLARELANRQDQESGLRFQTGPKRNPFGSGWQATQDIRESGLPHLYWGIIVEFVPMMHAYRVQGEFGQIHIVSQGSLTGLQPHGARQINILPLGTRVFYVLHPQSHHGVILCVDPGFMTDPRNHRSDYIVQGGHTGLYVDTAHDDQLSQLLLQGGIPCWAAGRPIDGTGVGEWGHMAETGLGIFLDPFLGYFRVDEETGLYLFYHDQLTRLSGHNLQIRSSVGEREDLDDQLEVSRIEGITPYGWEALGQFAYGDPSREYQSSDMLNGLFGIFEPSLDDQQPFYRKLNFDGYLGQGGKHIICLPPIGSQTYNRYPLLQNYIGVLSIQEGLEGTYAVESAKRIHFAKRITIPTPKMIMRPEDQRGDNDSNYKAAGLFGTVDGLENHKCADTFIPGPDTQGPIELVRAAAVLDLGAFVFNWQGLHPFFYHHKDWYLPEECAGYPFSSTQLPIDFCSLQGGQYLSAPTLMTIPVDHRNTSATYIPNESYFSMLEDGGICFGDGFGSEIKLTAGSIQISCPGDIFLQPGKNLNVWSGWDVILRAFNSIDLTTSRRDIRLKAEHNLMALAGNDGYGGMLFESRAKFPTYDFTNPGESVIHSGFLFLSKNAPFNVIASDISLDTSSANANPGGGNIRLDSGLNKIKTYAQNIENFIKGAKFDFFPESQVANEYWPNETLLGSSVVRINGSAEINGRAIINSDAIVLGRIATTDPTPSGCTGPMLHSIGDATIFLNEFLYLNNRLTTLNDFATAEKSTNYEYAIDAQIDQAEFSLRVLNDYRTSGFILYETRWQQLARMTTGFPATWKETPVVTLNSQLTTYPHPGKENWVDEQTWYWQNMTLYSIPAGAALNRKDNQAAYEEPTYGSTVRTIFDGNYAIIRSS